MSYKHLAGRLIETQRSMLGWPAVEVARSVDGLTVSDDGTVTAIAGDGRTAVEKLSRRYLDVLGDAAEDRLLAAAGEFEDELVLPPALGGPEEVPEDRRRPVEGPTPAGAAIDGQSQGAVSDGGTVAVESPPDGAAADLSGAVDAGDADEERRRDEERKRDETETDAEAEEGDESQAETEDGVSDPVLVEYTVGTDLATVARDRSALGTVYLLPAGDDGWGTPVTVADAVADAVSDATGPGDDAADAALDAVDPERLLATLNEDNGETVSFHVDGFTVTFHRSGSLAVH